MHALEALTLVTGASGFVGWHVARLLLERGHRVRALLRPGSSHSRSRRRTRHRRPARSRVSRSRRRRMRAASFTSPPITVCGRRIPPRCTARTWTARATCSPPRSRPAWSASSIPAPSAASAFPGGIGDETTPVFARAHGWRLQTLQVHGRTGGAGIRPRQGFPW